MRGRRLVARGIEIVAERGAERLLVARGDLDLVDDRRPVVRGRRAAWRSVASSVSSSWLREPRPAAVARARFGLCARARLLAASAAGSSASTPRPRRISSASRPLSSASCSLRCRSRPRLGKLALDLGRLALQAGARRSASSDFSLRPAALGARLGQAVVAVRASACSAPVERRLRRLASGVAQLRLLMVARLALRSVGAPPRRDGADMPSASAMCSSSRASRARPARAASRARPGAPWRAPPRVRARRARRSSRCSAAARAASSSRNGWSFSAASACWRSASPSALVSCATGASACWNAASSCSTWAQAPTQCR